MDEAMKQSSDILSFMKTIELGRDEVHYLKDEISKARTPVFEREEKCSRRVRKRLKNLNASAATRLKTLNGVSKRLAIRSWKRASKSFYLLKMSSINNWQLFLQPMQKKNCSSIP